MGPLPWPPRWKWKWNCECCTPESQYYYSSRVPLGTSYSIPKISNSCCPSGLPLNLVGVLSGDFTQLNGLTFPMTYNAAAAGGAAWEGTWNTSGCANSPFCFATNRTQVATVQFRCTPGTCGITPTCAGYAVIPTISLSTCTFVDYCLIVLGTGGVGIPPNYCTRSSDCSCDPPFFFFDNVWRHGFINDFYTCCGSGTGVKNIDLTIIAA